MREAQEREGLWFSLATLLPVLSGEPPKPDQPGPFPKLSQEPFGFPSVLKAHHKIVGVAHDNHVALRHFLAPSLHPQIENVV